MRGFNPFRRDVAWFEAKAAPIAPKLENLSFTKGQKSWRHKFRFGLSEVSASDMALIAESMGCSSAIAG